MRSRMAWRTAGRLGCGGGPKALFFSSRLSEPAGLQKSVGHHRHQGMAVKSAPGSSLKVIQAQLFLELLMGLFAYPARFDRASQNLDWRVGW